MSKVQSIVDPNYVNNQYRNASNLHARIRLHQEFSTNRYGWFRWLYDQLGLTHPGRVLELGCGPGNLWLENLDRIPPGLEVILSDLSAGMVKQARNNLDNSRMLFQFKIIDAQAIPFANDSFDIVLASHMLYHVPDRNKALSEIWRVLKPDGRFYGSTVGKKHMKEMVDLISRFDPQLASWGNFSPESFTLENGAAQLGAHFAHVSLHRYVDSLVVTDAAMLVDYILSGRIELDPGQRLNLVKLVEQTMKENNGEFCITKDSGVFESTVFV